MTEGIIKHCERYFAEASSHFLAAKNIYGSKL
jgi:hypothetical protein